MRNRRRSGNSNSLVWTVLLVALTIVVVIVAVIAVVKKDKTPHNSIGNIQQTEESEESEETEEMHSGYKMDTFVIFGVDSRKNELGKGTSSDSIMLVSMNHDLQEVRVVSILRDTFADTVEFGFEKLTYAYNYGGVKSALNTLNTNYDLNLKKYATFNFNSAGDIVDKLGGIEMEITPDEALYINAYIDEVNKLRGTKSKHITEAGTYVLDGTQTVAYSRIRYTDGAEVKRSERQRTVLFKMFQKTKNLGGVERVEMAEEFMDRIKTNFSTDKMTSLMYLMSQYEIKEMTVYPQQFYNGLIGEEWFQAPTTLIDMNRELHKVLLLEEDYVPSETVKDISARIEKILENPEAGKDQLDEIQ